MSNSRVLSGARSRRANESSSGMNGMRQTVSIGGRQVEMPAPGRSMPQAPQPPQSYSNFDPRFSALHQMPTYQQSQMALQQSQMQTPQQFYKAAEPPAAAAPAVSMDRIAKIEQTVMRLENTPTHSEEYETRFAMLANEIAELKDIVLKLQSYTMEVNKTLMQERVQILSDLESETDKTLFVMSSPEQPVASE